LTAAPAGAVRSGWVPECARLRAGETTKRGPVGGSGACEAGPRAAASVGWTGHGAAVEDAGRMPAGKRHRDACRAGRAAADECPWRLAAMPAPNAGGRALAHAGRGVRRRLHSPPRPRRASDVRQRRQGDRVVCGGLGECGRAERCVTRRARPTVGRRSHENRSGSFFERDLGGRITQAKPTRRRTTQAERRAVAATPCGQIGSARFFGTTTDRFSSVIRQASRWPGQIDSKKTQSTPGGDVGRARSAAGIRCGGPCQAVRAKRRSQLSDCFPAPDAARSAVRAGGTEPKRLSTAGVAGARGSESGGAARAR